jgi:serine protease Do
LLGIATLSLMMAAVAAFPVLAQETSVERAIPTSRGEIMLSFAPVVKKAAPAVVNIFSKRQVQQPGFVSPLFDDPLFKRFFGDQFGAAPRKRVEQSLGSGVIVTPEGLVVTNHHVIAGAEAITVVLSDRREFEAQAIISDEQTDLALLAIDPQGEPLPVLELKDSDTVEVGDLVLALGNPFGVGQTVTSGIVSALGRTQVDITDFSSFIQTDAAINPGNSGGALITLDGKLIGINTAIFSRSGGSVGIGFAIPSDMVRTVIAAAETGRIVRPWSGLSGQTLTADLAEAVDLDRPGGVIISEVHPEGPAATAGLKSGDVILNFDGHKIADAEDLRFRVATATLGEESTLAVRRGDETFTAALPLVAPPEDPPRNEIILRGKHPLAGAVAASLSPALSEELDLPGRWSGVVLIDIKRRSPAARLGFRPGDLLHAVNGRSFETSGELAEMLERGRTVQRWKITFQRGEKVRNVVFE